MRGKIYCYIFSICRLNNLTIIVDLHLSPFPFKTKTARRLPALVCIFFFSFSWFHYSTAGAAVPLGCLMANGH